ncbi:LysR family transcriptional regulator [Vibrio sp. WXL103]|uniref:LysR family transcriptional regulator n=1 Tax=Vibrio sp. WXL103 TaxID=3450710 RepID=UPI003EC6ABD3
MNQFNWKGIDLNLLVAFQALYQTRSVSLAAEQCFVSQSAMSHTLQRIRQLFADPMFERVGTRMEPTRRAIELAPKVNTLLSTIQYEFLAQDEFIVGAFKGVCKIGLTDYAEQLFAPALYDAIKSQAPQAQVSFFNVNRSNYNEMVERHEIDVVIGSIERAHSRYCSERLYTEQHLCLFDPKTVRFSNPVSLEEFIQVEQALVSPDGNLHTMVDALLAEQGVSRRVGVSSRHFLTIRRLLLGRELVCTVPKRFAEMEMDNHALKAAKAPIEVADFDIQLLYLKSRQHEEPLKWLIECVRAVVK